MDTVVLILVIAAAAFYIFHKVWKMVKGGGCGCGCGGSSSDKSKNSKGA